MISPHALNVTNPVNYTDAITGVAWQVYMPLASSQYGYNDEIRIPIPEQDAYYTLPGASGLLIDGKLNKADKAKATDFVLNGIMHLFYDIRYEINNVLVDKIRYPGLTGTMKGLPSFPNTIRHQLANAGFHKDFNLNVVHSDGTFLAYVPLKYVLGFAEDIKSVIVGQRQDLILTRSRNDNDVLYVDTTEETASASVEM